MIMASKGMEDIVKQISELSVKDLAALIKKLEEEFGVSASAMVAAPAVSAAPAAGAVPAAEEKSEYKVTLKDAGANKMNVIKALRTMIQGLSIVDAKEKVENTPVIVAESAPKEEAMKMKDELEKAGAKVELS
jgi:large subunit ribosomal protein L7/L12